VLPGLWARLRDRRGVDETFASERHRLAGSGARRRTLWLARG
jgi:hypothetical protein